MPTDKTSLGEINARLVQALLDGSPYFAVFDGGEDVTEMVANCPPEYLLHVAVAACFALGLSHNEEELDAAQVQARHAEMTRTGIKLVMEQQLGKLALAMHTASPTRH